GCNLTHRSVQIQQPNDLPMALRYILAGLRMSAWRCSGWIKGLVVSWFWHGCTNHAVAAHTDARAIMLSAYTLDPYHRASFFHLPAMIHHRDPFVSRRTFAHEFPIVHICPVRLVRPIRT